MCCRRALVFIVFWLCCFPSLMTAQAGTALSPSQDDEVIRISRDTFLRLAVSDAVREATGLWRDRVHWRVSILSPEAARSENWAEAPYEPDKKTIVVFLDHPNGVDRAHYETTYSFLEETAKAAIDRVLKDHGREAGYLSHAVYVGRIGPE